MSGTPVPAPSQSPPPARRRRGVSLAAAGEPMLWLGGGALTICLVMIAGLFALILWQGMSTFWPQRVERMEVAGGGVFMGEVTRRQGPAEDVPGASSGGRRLVRTANYRLTQSHYEWVDESSISASSFPEWALVLERLEWGRFYGMLQGMAVLEPLPPEGMAGVELSPEGAGQGDGDVRLAVTRSVDGLAQDMLVPPGDVADGDVIIGRARAWMTPEAAWESFNRLHPQVLERWRQRRRLEDVETGRISHREEKARLAMRQAEIDLEQDASPGNAAELDRRRSIYEDERALSGEQFAAIREEIRLIDQENGRYRLLLTTAGEGTMAPRQVFVKLDEIVRAYPANGLGVTGRLGVYASRWWEFLFDEPREANSEGGVYPALFGTVIMTLLMSLAVVPLGVLAALYLREYAKAGLMVSAVRVAVNNLAGVPSIVFGVFGLGFFCYIVGASLDQLLFASSLPNPTYGKGGVLWASLTLALLTLPVVIVATEEALSAVPNSMREGSYACGASKWQTIQRIILPRALPGITTGMILAIARGAGEVAPLMLVGAVKLAPELALDGVLPFIHPERSFMHLGFHIYDVGFQSQNSEAAKPMVYTTTVLLITIIALLNLAAVSLRTRLRRRFATSGF